MKKSHVPVFNLKNRIIPLKSPVCWSLIIFLFFPLQGVYHSTDFIEWRYISLNNIKLYVF